MKETDFKTFDLYFAAFLVTAKCKMLGQHKLGNRIEFLFEANPRISALHLEYINRTAQISALDYADNIRNLKTLCHSKS